MNAMTKALKKVDLAIPLIQRSWMWIKDHPGSSVADIANGINAPKSDVSSVCSQLMARKMVTRESISTKFGKSNVYTALARMKVYELYALPPKGKKAALAEIPAAIEPPRPKSAKDFLNELSVAQAFELYTELKRMFNP